MDTAHSRPKTPHSTSFLPDPAGFWGEGYPYIPQNRLSKWWYSGVDAWSGGGVVEDGYCLLG